MTCSSTKEVCKASKIAGCKKVILISTDKAVRPSNILGASKRLSELVVQAFAEEENLTSKDSGVKTIFTMVRFGMYWVHLDQWYLFSKTN